MLININPFIIFLIFCAVIGIFVGLTPTLNASILLILTSVFLLVTGLLFLSFTIGKILNKTTSK